MRTISIFLPGAVAVFIWAAVCQKPVETTTLFEHRLVDAQPPANPWAKMAADINGDGLNDIVFGGQKGPLVWYQAPDWQRFPIVNGGYDTVDGECADVNADGDIDVIMGGLFWYENPGDLPANPAQNWRTHKIAEHGTHDVEAADLDGDGDMDVVTRNQSEFNALAGNRIHLWLQESPDAWREKIIACPHGEGFALADLDGDNDIDLVTGGLWFENSDSEWPAHHFADWHSNAMVKVADINADSRPDVVLTPSELAGQTYKISLFAAPPKPQADNWVEHIIADSVECVFHSLTLADFNGDGAIDIACAEMHQSANPDEVIVLLNRENGESWEKHVLSNKGSHGLLSADLTGDGRPDLLGANWSSDFQPVEVWENRMAE